MRLYGEPQALPGLLELAREQLRVDGIPGQHLCVVSGALDAIERVLQAHLRPGDRVAVENPGYAALYDVLRAHGLVLEPVALDDHGMLPDDLRAALARGASAAVLTPRGQNPTGAALDAERARELREVLAESPHTLVIEDDHLGPVAGSEPAHVCAPGARRWAATRSVAKALGPDLRLAVLAGDAADDRACAGTPAVRARLGQPYPAEPRSRPVERPRRLALVERAGATYAHRRERLLACLDHQGVRARGLGPERVGAGPGRGGRRSPR